MRFLVDQNLTNRLVNALNDAGYDAIHVSSIGLEAASDPEVFRACRQDNRVLITSDKRLAKYLAAQHAANPSVVIVRGVVRGADAIGLVIERIDDVARVVAERGDAVFSMTPDLPTRVRLLPLGPLSL